MMNEEKVKEIHKAIDLMNYSHKDLREADAWVKAYALEELRVCLAVSAMGTISVEFICRMARCHYGSWEVDEYLRALKCYPEWLEEHI